MFNRFLTKISDAGKASPSRSPGAGNDDSRSDLGSPDEYATDEAAEGFLCPNCMLRFPNAEVLQDHYDSTHSTNDTGTGEAHVCTACKMKLGTARELESHFARHHMPPKSNDKSNAEESEMLSNSSLRQELDDLHTSLKEERWYTHELKKEIERLQSSVEFGKGDGISRTEADMFYQNQIKVLEESKSLALNEVVLLKEHLSDSREELSRLRIEKDKLEQRAAGLASDLANIKANLDEITTEKYDLGQKLKDSEVEVNSLRAEVEQRIGAEDALLLRQELVNVQRAMDELTLAKEVEKNELQKSCEKLVVEKSDLQKALSAAPDLAETERLRSLIVELKESVKDLKEEKLYAQETFEERFEEFHSSSEKELSAERDKVLKLEKQASTLEGALEESRSAFKKFKDDNSKSLSQQQLEAKEKMQEYTQEIATLRSESKKLQRYLEEKEALVQEMTAKTERLDKHCQDNLALIENLKDEVTERTLQHEESVKDSNERQRKILQMETDAATLLEQLGRLEVERKDLYAKIESGDGAKTAIAQLQQENVTLQDQVKKLQESAGEAQKEMKSKLEEQAQQQKQQKEKTAMVEKELVKTKSSLTQTQEQVQELTSKCGRLEKDVEKKEKQVEQLESSKSAETLQLEKDLITERQKSEELTQKSGELQTQLTEATSQLSVEQKSSTEMKQKLQKLQAKYVENEKQLSVSKDREHLLQNTILDMKKTTDSNKKKVTALESQAAKFEAELKESILTMHKLKEINKAAENGSESLKQEVAKLNKDLDSKNAELENRTRTIGESTEEIAELKKQMEDDAAEYHKLSESNAALENRVKEAESSLADTGKALQETTAELTTAKINLDASKEKERQLSDDINELKKNSGTFEKQATDRQTRVAELELGNQKLQERVTVTENELDSSRTTCKSFELKCDNLEDELKDREFRLRQEMESLSTAEEARAILIDQKLKLQSELEDSVKRIQEEVEKRKSVVTEFTAKETEMHDQMAKLNKQVEKQRLKHKEDLQNWDDTRAQLEGQASVLQENLSTLRQDFAAEKDRTAVLEVKVDEIGGQKLELDAKLENALDERRALLDRCLRSEEECEKLRGTTVELRRKLDDTLAALHELGRENQSLQIENTKLVQRKWAEDAEVTHCTACRKQFTVTIRKHHCRSCGSIFCNECSARTATIASYKKAVRVCDSCYDEVGQ